MKKLILLLVFIPLVSFAQTYSAVKNDLGEEIYDPYSIVIPSSFVNGSIIPLVLAVVNACL